MCNGFYSVTVVPADQSFNANEYCGLFHFCIWHFGRWWAVQPASSYSRNKPFLKRHIMIIDLLPTDGKELIFLSSESRTDFWSALLEKALAKFEFKYGSELTWVGWIFISRIYGSYEALYGGLSGDGMKHFTGGISEFVCLNDLKYDMAAVLQLLCSSVASDSLMACSIDVNFFFNIKYYQ